MEPIPATLPAPSVAVLLADRTRQRGDAPLLTFVDPASGERTELGYLTAENWTAKVAHLLRDAGVDRGDVVTVDVADHWTTAVVALATWRAGAVVGLGDGPATVTVTGEGAAASRTSAHLVVGDGFGGRPVSPLPDGAVGFDDVLTMPDTFDDVATGPDDPALRARSGLHLQGHLLAAAAAAGVPQGARVLLEGPLRSPAGLAGGVLGALTAGGALVVVRTDDAGRKTAIAEQERANVTLHVGPTTLAARLTPRVDGDPDRQDR